MVDGLCLRFLAEATTAALILCIFVDNDFNSTRAYRPRYSRSSWSSRCCCCCCRPEVNGNQSQECSPVTHRKGKFVLGVSILMQLHTRRPKPGKQSKESKERSTEIHRITSASSVLLYQVDHQDRLADEPIFSWRSWYLAEMAWMRVTVARRRDLSLMIGYFYSLS